jgi:hypothetical protein
LPNASHIQTAEYTLQFINQTQRSIFLTGKAGTGRDHAVARNYETTHKNTVVVAPTGIAALNAGGVTIHSMFQLPFGGFIPAFNVESQFTETVKFESKILWAFQNGRPQEISDSEYGTANY